MLITLICIHKTTGEGWYPWRLVILVKRRCFASKNHRRGLGPLETSNSDANHADFHSQNDWWGLVPMETRYSGPEVAVLHAKTTGVVFDRQTLEILVLKSLFCMLKATGEGWNPHSPFILVLSTLLCVLKTTDEVWDPYRLVTLDLKSLFAWKKKLR